MRGYWVSIVFLVASLAGCSGSSQPAATAPERSGTARSSLDRDQLGKKIEAYVGAIGDGWGAGYQFSGYIHVATDDGVLYSRGFGLANAETGARNTADTSFRTGSVTKQFTAAAIMLLQQDGKLSVHDPIRRHLPDYPAPAGDQITVHHLLTHTSGIPNYTTFPELMDSRMRARTVAELLATFSDRPLEFAPGDRFRYSNSGYAVLGAIIEAASGQTYGEFLSDRLFVPAGLKNTVVGDAQGAPDRALGYQTNGEGVAELAAAVDMSVPYAAGAVRSTAADLVRWSQALETRILTPASLQQMYTPTPPSMKDGSGYGYGWLITTGQETVIHHNGGIDGFLSSYVRVPARGLVIVVWTNNPAVDVDPIKEAVVLAAFGGTPEPPASTRPATLEPAFAARVTGAYQLEPASRAAMKSLGAPDETIASIETMTIRAAGAGLELAPIGQPAVPLHVRDETTLFTRSPAVELALTIEGSAAATGFVLKQGGVELTYVRH
ncbi:MAG TPA: serine hydrolase domain-containing protein [Kofleriaceae bacterium]|nr:serine hydrolase domain-containing protein [Kofleriaceae bacterium]